ncbi:piggyBac transposable element-derived protein 4-like [Acanthopagrus schlegelii]
MARRSLFTAEDVRLFLDASDHDGSFSSAEEEEESCHFQLQLDSDEEKVCDENISPARKKARRQPAQQQLSWKTESDDDVAPTPLKFLPARKPGVKLSSEDGRSPLDFFKLFFSDDAVETLCRNTNKQAARSTASWTDVGVAEFYSYIGLILYLSTVRLKNTAAFWRENSIFTIPFPSQVMSRDRYEALSRNVHMSDPDEDTINDTKTGTSQRDRLFRVKPLMETIQKACRPFYHPSRSLVVDERMVPCKGHSRRNGTIRNTPTKCCFKLFVLTDSSNGYTVDFSVYTGKNNFSTGRGLSCDSVMSLIDRRHLGSGYHVHMDSFFRSPKLFRDLLASEFGACGTCRDSRSDCPRSAVNALTKTSPTFSLSSG